MAVVTNCKICGKEHVIEGGIVFEGTIQEALEHIERKQNEVTEKCCGLKQIK